LETKAFFLDRDGVINRRRDHYVKTINEFEIFDEVASAIELIKNNNYLVIIITNQSAINRNLLSIEMLEKIHNTLINYLKLNNTTLDAIYYCPHLPDENCNCRKPKPGMILQAANEFNINLKKSLFIGDSNSDMEAAAAAGCKGVLLNENESLLELIKKIMNDPNTEFSSI